jgi:hypothetical protein
MVDTRREADQIRNNNMETGLNKINSSQESRKEADLTRSNVRQDWVVFFKL